MEIAVPMMLFSILGLLFIGFRQVLKKLELIEAMIAFTGIFIKVIKDDRKNREHPE